MTNEPKDEAWKAARVPGPMDPTDVDIQYKRGRRCVVIRQRPADSIVSHVVVVPIALFKGIAAKMLADESNAEVAASQHDIAIARLPIPPLTEPS